MADPLVFVPAADVSSGHCQIWPMSGREDSYGLCLVATFVFVAVLMLNGFPGRLFFQCIGYDVRQFSVHAGVDHL